MAKDLYLTLEDKPGEAARLGEALGNAGVNIEGLCAMADGGRSTVHILVDDAARCVGSRTERAPSRRGGARGRTARRAWR